MEGAESMPTEHVNRLVPILEPPFELQPPRVALPARSPAFPSSAPFQDLIVQEQQWTCSTHIFPAAWPRTRLRSVQGRSSRFQPVHYPRPAPKGKDEATKEAEWLINHQEQAGFIDIDKPETYEDQDQLWVAVNRYAPAKSRKRTRPGYTLVFSHATGLHKESCEAVIAHLITSKAGELIEEVWSLDCVNQGDSSLLNRDKLGDAFYWPDSGRDIAKFLLLYLPQLGVESLQKPAYVLPKQPVSDPSLLECDWHAGSPLNKHASSIPSGPQVWRGRLIIGSGHSLGGGCTNYAASSLPRLFAGLLYTDPILPPASQKFRNKLPITAGALSRRDKWESREAAAANFAAKKDFFGRWHPAVLLRYVDFALSPSPYPSGSTIELKTLKRDEALVFADTPSHSGEQSAGNRLVYLPSWLKKRTAIIWPDIGRSVFPEHALKEMGENAKGAKLVRMKDAAHLLIQEKPKEVAHEMSVFLRVLDKEGQAKL